MQIFFSPLAGFLADRTSPSLVASAGMGMIAAALAALAILAMLGTQTSFVWIYTALILIGLGISFFSAPNTSIIIGSVPENKRGMAGASNSIMRNIGMQVSIILCGSAFLVAVGDVRGIAPEHYGAMLTATRICYAVFAAVCVIGLMIQSSARNPELTESQAWKKAGVSK